MRIILDAKFLSGKSLPAYHHFLLDAIIEMARRHADDSFIFLTHEQGKIIPGLPSNISVQHIRKGPLQWLGEKWWYKNVLAKKVKKLQPGLFVATDNLYVNNNGLPTCLFIIGLNSLLEVKEMEVSGLALKFLNISVKNATALITFSEYSRQMIKRQTSFSAEKIKLLQLRLNSPVMPLIWTEKESAKVKYAAGCEYFVFAGEIDPAHNLLGLLKAFSQFKKRQQSNMQLVLAVHKTAWMAEFNEKLNTFKYRADVHVITNPSNEELNLIVGAAYAFVYPAQVDYFPVNIIRAMKAGVPVIASKVPVIEEQAGNAVIYTADNNDDGFAKCMQDIYKDENLRSYHIETAKNQLLAAKEYDMVEDCRNFFEVIFTSKS